MQGFCGVGLVHLQRCEFLASGIREARRFEGRRSAGFFWVCAGENKRQPNFIDIGGARREGWDEVKVVRTTQAPEGRKEGKKKAEAARSPVSQVDVEPLQQSPVVEATKRGRGGKTVTVIKGLQLRVESLEVLCKSLKVKMGSGGAVKDGEIEIQGDHSAKLLEELLKLGFKAKKSGR